MASTRSSTSSSSAACSAPGARPPRRRRLTGQGATLLAEAPGSGWRAQLALGFTEVDGRTRLSRRRHLGPLLVQRPFHPEGPVCHVYVIHPPGGIVGGDRLALDVDVGPRAEVLLTTPGATRFYRAGPAGEARLAQSLVVRDGTLEWLPQETIFFAGAQARATTRVDLHGQARFMGWEIACYGRTAGDLPFTEGRVHQRFEVWRDDLPLVIDAQRLEGSSSARTAMWGLQGHPVLGTLLACPATQAELDAARVALGNDSPPAAATLVDDVLLCRALGAQALTVRARLARVWAALRPSFCGREACPPRIWAT